MVYQNKASGSFSRGFVASLLPKGLAGLSQSTEALPPAHTSLAVPPAIPLTPHPPDFSAALHGITKQLVTSDYLYFLLPSLASVPNTMPMWLLVQPSANIVPPNLVVSALASLGSRYSADTYPLQSSPSPRFWQLGPFPSYRPEQLTGALPASPESLLVC